MRKLHINFYKNSLLAMSLFLGFSLANAAPKIDDFTHTATLSDAKTSLRQLELPIDVYTKMYRNDYGDLRIFSADGQIVPHQFSLIESEDPIQLEPLVFYPFNKDQLNDDGNISIAINQGYQKKQVEIHQSFGNKTEVIKQNTGEVDKQSEYQYIIENKENLIEGRTALCGLKLSWEQSIPSVILRLQLESSNNLQQWKSLNRELSVSRLSYDKSQLVRDEISFDCTNDSFVRLSWLDQKVTINAQVKLNEIQGFYTQEIEQALEWKSFGKPVYTDDGAWLFESDVVAPLFQMAFIPPQNSLLFKGDLYSRKDPNDKWRYRKKVIQYLIDAQLPEVRAKWRSHKILFIAQGKPPFQLAFGNPNVLPAQNNDLNHLIHTFKDSGAIIDKVTLLNFEDKELVFLDREKDFNGKKIVFWIVLLLGTLLMAFMAFRLLQQMTKNDHN